MPVGQKNHQGVAMPMAVLLRGLDQLLDLILRQVLPGPNFSIFGSAWLNCSIYSYWGDEPQAWFCHVKSPFSILTVQYRAAHVAGRETIELKTGVLNQR